MWAGTYKQKKVIKLAPDAVVQINNKKTIQICPLCDGQMDLSNYITSLQTSLSNNSTIGTASVVLAIPRHGHQGNYMVRGGRVFGINLMDEICIYIKGRFPTDESGNRPYYRCFWGVITSVSESFSDGIQTVSIGCESMLKWLQIMQTNEQPSVSVLQDPAFQIDVAPALTTGKSYSEMNAYQIIYALVNITFLNMIIPESLTTEQVKSENGDISLIEPINPKEIELSNAWRDKFLKIRGSLRMFGTSSKSFIKEETPAKDKETIKQKGSYINASVNPYTPYKILYDSAALMDFKPFANPDGAKLPETIQNNYKNNLEIIGEVTLLTGFEFFLDTVGELIFKPPFWNLDVKQNPVYVLEDSDILSWDFVESSESIVTRVLVSGSLDQVLAGDPITIPRGCFTNYALARQFGLISHPTISMRYFIDKDMCYYHAISEMDRINAMRFKGSIKIIGRPELRLGIPIYIKSRDCYGYIENVSHNFTFGSGFTTDIQVTAIRRKYIGTDPMAASFDEKLGNNIKNIVLRGQPAILLYENDLIFAKEVAEKNPKFIIAAEKNKTINPSKEMLKEAKAYRDSNQYFRSNRPGTYTEVPLNSPKATEALKAAKIAKINGNQEDYLRFLEIAIPISDEEGYELIGVYENGRSLLLDKNNVLRKKQVSVSTIIEGMLKEVEINSNFAAAGVYVPIPDAIPEPTSGILKDTNVGPSIENLKNSAISQDVQDFYKNQATSLNSLIPNLDKNIKKCSCHDPALTGLLKQGSNKPGDKIDKTMAGVSTRGSGRGEYT